MDKIADKNRLLVETHRSGHFSFEIDLDLISLEPLRAQVEEAYAHFRSIPLMHDMANNLENLVQVTAIYGSNTIEGGLLSEEETEEILLLPPEKIKDENQRSIVNLKNAYEFASHHANMFLEEKNIKAIHRLVTEGLTHRYNQPGEYRNNTKENPTVVGNAQHGGVYKPPKCFADIKILMKAFVQWANGESLLKLSSLYRAPLIHLYFERIHPFWDGNGRVGRVLEAMVLQKQYNYAPHAMSGFYLRNIDEYFALFNSCRKKSEKKESNANTAFVEFFLKGLLDTFHRFHDKANEFLGKLGFASQIMNLSQSGEINSRQRAILEYIFKHEHTIVNKKMLASEAWYQALYSHYHSKTKERDWKQLVSSGLISVESNEIHIHLFPKHQHRLSKG